MRDKCLMKAWGLCIVGNDPYYETHVSQNLPPSNGLVREIHSHYLRIDPTALYPNSRVFFFFLLKVVVLDIMTIYFVFGCWGLSKKKKSAFYAKSSSSPSTTLSLLTITSIIFSNDVLETTNQ